ncbi:GNAT family N-acetyltransferase [Wohlfahrtiimonas larvae]|uniref:N-acetyltransferase domain-containing protein n=1 Tax=Wohlfahrtiimonas larvae TaxID=1157986 RepID=A0ABP9MY25_9GAMM|nr:GNAT family N-acetyltransferase [Wohlfahrtiimonas larvae]
MIKISHAQLIDLSAIEQIYTELFIHMAELQPDYYLKASQDPAFIQTMIESDDSALLIAKQANQTLGFIMAQEQATPSYNCIAPHKFAYIFDFVVTEKARGLGIGKQLMNAMEVWAKSRDLDYIELSVLSNNTEAHKLYENIGYTDATHIMRKSL